MKDMTLVDRPFIVKKEKGEEFLKVFNTLPRLSKDFLDECKKTIKRNYR